MYEAMRQRAPGSSKLAGVASTILITGLAGYALANGVGGDIVKVLERTTIYAVPEKPVEPLPDIDRIPIGDDIDLVVPTSPIPDDFFVPDDDTPIKAERRTPVDTEREAAIAPATPPARKAPRLISKEKPPYPAPDIRGRNEGDTGVEVCVAANGRVSSAQLATSSGHPRLDAAALKWVRSARFTPGSVGGAPQTMCGHTVVYEWRLKDVTR